MIDLTVKRIIKKTAREKKEKERNHSSHEKNEICRRSVKNTFDV